MIKKVLPLVLIAVAASCQATPPMPAVSLGTPYLDGSAASGTVAELGSTVEIRIDTGTTMQTQAARKTVADIDHYHVKLVNVDTGVVLVEGDTTNLVNFFHKVLNGTYKVVVDALDAAGNSVVQGGAQDSLNTVMVASPNVTYSDDASCLKVRLKLLNATGESVGSKIVVDDGDEWTGTPNMTPGGSCPCPTPTPSPVVDACAAPVPGTLITSGTTTYNGAYAPYTDDVFAGGYWNSGTNGSAWINHEFNRTVTVSGYRWKEFASDPRFGNANYVVKLRKPEGTWVTVETLTNVNFVASDNPTWAGQYATGNTPHEMHIDPPVDATAIRFEIAGHGWFGGQCFKVWSPALVQ
jgi:hypothetical protein